MTNPSALIRSLFIWILIIPVGLLLGSSLTGLTHFQLDSMAIMGVALLFLTLPLWMKFHHAWLLVSWNMSAVIFFLPGRPQLWMAMTGISLIIGVIQATVNPQHRFISTPTISRPLILLAFIVLLTAKLTGGLGLASLGSEVYGGKRYVWIWASILGYFAITSRAIPLDKAYRYTALFFLGGVTMAIGNLFGFLGQGFTWLFLIFPVETLLDLESADGRLMRSWALPYMSIAVFCAMMAKYGLSGTFNLKHPWRVTVLGLFLFVGMLGGFRTMVVMIGLTMAVLFYLEGLMRSRMLPAVLLSVILGGALITVFANRLPLSVQRSLAVLPLDIDPVVKLNAQASSEWRIQMWRNLLPEIPNHLIVGKGYGFSASEIGILMATLYTSGASRTSGAELVGDYHNGPLSVILPLGLPGTFAFMWFILASLRAVYQNYQYGNPALKVVNRFIFAYYLARVVFFFTVFGSLYSDLAVFTGLVGLSVSLNNGIAKPEPAPVPESVMETLKFAPQERSAAA